MRKTILAATLGLIIGATGAGAAISWAQPMPGGAGGPPPGGPAAHWVHHGHWGHKGPWGHGQMGWHHPPRMVAPGTFALLAPTHDRELTPADVQTIAQGFLLWHGNHSWKVGDVAAQGTDLIGFAFTSAKGDVIARFTIDRHTGRIARVG